MPKKIITRYEDIPDPIITKKPTWYHQLINIIPKPKPERDQLPASIWVKINPNTRRDHPDNW